MPMFLCLKAQNNPRPTIRKKGQDILRQKWQKSRTIRTSKERLLHETNPKKAIRRRRKNKQSKSTME
jgi:hypothetical protein